LRSQKENERKEKLKTTRVGYMYFMDTLKRPQWGITLNFDVWGVLANVIIHTKFFVNWFRDFVILTPKIWISP